MNPKYTPHQLDPYEELRTMPQGWNLSAMQARPSHSPPLPESLESVGEFPGEMPGGWTPEKFGSPRTTPRGWDVSNLR